MPSVDANQTLSQGIDCGHKALFQFIQFLAASERIGAVKQKNHREIICQSSIFLAQKFFAELDKVFRLIGQAEAPFPLIRAGIFKVFMAF